MAEVSKTTISSKSLPFDVEAYIQDAAHCCVVGIFAPILRRPSSPKLPGIAVMKDVCVLRKMPPVSFSISLQRSLPCRKSRGVQFWLVLLSQHHPGDRDSEHDGTDISRQRFSRSKLAACFP